MSEDAGLFTRAPFGDDLAILRARYPREVWPGHANLGNTARFWLDRHGMFRELGGLLTEGAGAFREGQIEAEPFLRWLGPRLSMFLNQLHHHHQVEDAHYFPIFRAADPKLARAFEILDADHHVLDETIAELASAGNALAAAVHGGGDVPGASAALAERLTHGSLGLVRHLDDEEDIVVPLILDRTEAGLAI